VPRRPARSPHDFVSFDRPPVTEVALTAQFNEPVVDLAALGAFAEQVRRQFPNQTQRPPADAIEPETFDQIPNVPPFTIQLQPQAALPRIWFESKNRERLIQLQADRLSVNWRLLDGDPSHYPRYSKLRQIFKQQLKRLSSILMDRERQVRVAACEVLYVNPIEPLEKTERGTHPDLASVINRLRSSPKGSFLGKPEDSQWQARWRIPRHGDDQPSGRLYVSAAPAVSERQTPIYVVQTVGRTIPTSPDLEGAVEALDIGHKWVVKGFADVTTNKMHQAWGRKD
jgi:uncharacterized protein (TIGR04255 family)